MDLYPNWCCSTCLKRYPWTSRKPSQIRKGSSSGSVSISFMIMFDFVMDIYRTWCCSISTRPSPTPSKRSSSTASTGTLESVSSKRSSSIDSVGKGEAPSASFTKNRYMFNYIIWLFTDIYRTWYLLGTCIQVRVTWKKSVSAKKIRPYAWPGVIRKS